MQVMLSILSLLGSFIKSKPNQGLKPLQKILDQIKATALGRFEEGILQRGAFETKKKKNNLAVINNHPTAVVAALYRLGRAGKSQPLP
jgi:hypothetical protein